jgi:hypothetical protein
MKGKTTRHGLAQGRGSAAAMIVATLLMSFMPALYAVRTPVLMLLEHTQAGKPVQTKIEVKAGLVASPDKGKPQAKWIIRAGDAFKSAVQPDDRSVNFYQSTGTQQITLLFIVKVRYYQYAAGRWLPRFLLNEEPLVIRENGRWQPLTSVQGVASLIVQTGTALPNAEGYFPSLEFGMSTGATAIDAWLVQ